MPAKCGAKTDNPKKYKLANIITIPIQNETILMVDSPSERLISIVPMPIAIKFNRPIRTSIKKCLL